MFRHYLPHNQRFTNRRLYTVTSRLLPATAERLEAYRHTLRPRRNLQVQIRDDDVITFIFDPNLNHVAHPVDDYEDDVNGELDQLNLDANIRGTVTLHLTREATRRGAANLGGMAQVIQNFQDRPHLNLEAFLDEMEERNYMGFEINNVLIMIDINLR
jgi:hypothetical protein